MADHTITLDAANEALLQRAATAKHMTPRGFIRFLVGHTLQVARGVEINAATGKTRDGVELAALLTEADAVRKTLGDGILPADDPDRLELLPTDPPDPVPLAPE